jgi:hypothetical protein
MSFEEEAIRRWQRHIDELRVYVKQMESGELTLISGLGSGAVNVTDQAIERDKATIKLLEDLLVKLRDRRAGGANA